MSRTPHNGRESFVRLSPPFKYVTAMSPSAFQKQIRIRAARRPMAGENMDIAGDEG
jgi:methylphosphotriester-DNA--protein-cysteine methyltransferase